MIKNIFAALMFKIDIRTSSNVSAALSPLKLDSHPRHVTECCQSLFLALVIYMFNVFTFRIMSEIATGRHMTSFAI